MTLDGVGQGDSYDRNIRMHLLMIELRVGEYWMSFLIFILIIVMQDYTPVHT